jgi:predicted nucleotidyltransferase component of viral defense system
VRVDTSEVADALSEGFEPATAEKVYRLLRALRALQEFEDTRNRFTLKGGTALNIFLSERVPRLSVDLDLMVTGYPAAAANSAELLRVVGILERLSREQGYSVRRVLSDAACTLRLGYLNHLGTKDQIKLDLDFLNRVTLHPPFEKAGPRLFAAEDWAFPVVAPAELFGQKLTAVAYRGVERDLFDMWKVLRMSWHTLKGARSSYLAYSLLQDAEWHRLDYPTRLNVDYRTSRLEDVLRVGEAVPSLEEIRATAAASLGAGTPEFTAATPDEQRLRRRILDGDEEAFGDLAGEQDPARRTALSQHPGLRWRLRQFERSRGSGDGQSGSAR